MRTSVPSTAAVATPAASANAILRPSGDQSGSAPVSKGRRRPPMTRRSRPCRHGRRRAGVRRAPTTGVASPGPEVIARAALPLRRATTIRPSRTNASQRPSADHEGSLPRTSIRGPVPSVLTRVDGPVTLERQLAPARRPGCCNGAAGSGNAPRPSPTRPARARRRRPGRRGVPFASVPARRRSSLPRRRRSHRGAASVQRSETELGAPRLRMLSEPWDGPRRLVGAQVVDSLRERRDGADGDVLRRRRARATPRACASRRSRRARR